MTSSLNDHCSLVTSGLLNHPVPHLSQARVLKATIKLQLSTAINSMSAHEQHGPHMNGWEERRNVACGGGRGDMAGGSQALGGSPQPCPPNRSGSRPELWGRGSSKPQGVAAIPTRETRPRRAVSEGTKLRIKGWREDTPKREAKSCRRSDQTVEVWSATRPVATRAHNITPAGASTSPLA